MCFVTAASAVSTVSVSGRPTVSRSWILPFCSRRRRPSARKKKSSLPRSAVWARWMKESNSIWLRDRGSCQTVVLFTPGKYAARITCFNGALIGPSSRWWWVWRARWSSSVAAGGRVAADRTGEAEPGSQRGLGVFGAERALRLQHGHQAVDDEVE